MISIPKVPLLKARSIPKLSRPELATTISDRLSLLKSPMATEVDCEAEPVEYAVVLQTLQHYIQLILQYHLYPKGQRQILSVYYCLNQL